jgi:2-methylcitrate dehydratase PrpD
MSEQVIENGENYTGKFAKLIVDTTYESLPDEAIALAKRSFMDCVGAAMAGTPEKSSKLIVELTKELGGNNKCSVIGGGFKTSAPNAALANGLTTHVLEFDDASGEAWSAHPSAVIVPTVLAMAEHGHISGKEALLAYIIGLEAGARIGRAMREGHYEFGYVGGWQNTATIGAMASCAAACKALKLNVEKTTMAFGIAGSMASGLNKANVGTMTKAMHAGIGARNGVIAALMGEKGLTASPTIFDGQWGFCSMFTNYRECHIYKLVDGFGSPWDVIDPGITFKPFPSCRATHPSIDAIFRMKRKHGIKASDIKEIVARTSVHLYEVLKYHRPQNVIEAKFCLEYCIAIALNEGEVRLKHFKEDKWLKDSNIQKLMEKVRYEYPQPWETGLNAPQQIVLKMNDGKSYTQKLSMPETLGNPSNPVPKEELEAKFNECAEILLSSAEVSRANNLLNEIENLPDLDELMNLLNTKIKS